MLKLISYLKDFRKEIILGPLFKLIEAILELIVPLVMVKIIDVGVKNSDPSYVLKMGAIMLLLGVVGFACSLTCQRYAAIASQGGGTVIRNAVFRHINTFSHAEVDRFGTPSLITRISNDVNQLQLAIAMFIRLVIRAPFLVIGSVVMAMILDLKLSIIFIITTPVILLILYLIMSRSVPFFHIIQQKLDKISLITRENLGGSRVIRAFSKQEMEKDRFYEASSDHTNTAIKVGRISALLNPLTYATINLAIVAIIWYGGIRVDVGGMTQGQVIAYINYMSQILLALVIIANLVVLFTRAAASAARVNEVLDVKSTIVSSHKTNNAISENIGLPKIEFKNVAFAYGDTSKYAIQDINIKIRKGETVGIIGATGSGKSTIINLIPRLYDVSKGDVLVDGKNVKNYRLNDLRRKIGLVPQRAVLFSGTVDDNIRWGDQDATDEDIKRALDIAQAWEFVDGLAKKGHTMIRQGGKNLSGGQKQRLTIARALVGKPDILILDDSASALDFTTDAALRKALKERTQDTTVIMVSQRVSSIMDADKIIVLDNGIIKGIGTHAQLNISSDVYKEICLSQLKEEEVNKHA